MKPETWKVIAIIFIVLFTLEAGYVIWSFYYVARETNNLNVCYYDFCSETPEATYSNGICYCYDYDVIGNLVPVKTKVMK